MGKKRLQMQRKEKYQLSHAQMSEVSERAVEEFQNGYPVRPVPAWALMSNQAYAAYAFALSDEIERLEKVVRND